MKTVSYCLLLTAYCLLLPSCDIKKRLSRSQTKSKTTESYETSFNRRFQLNTDWSQIGSSFFHRDGITWIDFDSLASVRIQPDGQIEAVGYNPVLISSATLTYRDTSSTLATTRLLLEEDSTGSRKKSNSEAEKSTDRTKETKTQRVGPILVLALLLLIGLIYGYKQIKLF